jgi:hypothetical protein
VAAVALSTVKYHGPLFDLQKVSEDVDLSGLIRRLDEAEGRIKGLLLDTANLAATAALSTVRCHDLLFDLQKVSEDMDLSVLIRHEDIVAAAEEVIKMFDFGTD